MMKVLLVAFMILFSACGTGRNNGQEYLVDENVGAGDIEKSTGESNHDVQSSETIVVKKLSFQNSAEARDILADLSMSGTDESDRNTFIEGRIDAATYLLRNSADDIRTLRLLSECALFAEKESGPGVYVALGTVCTIGVGILVEQQGWKLSDLSMISRSMESKKGDLRLAGAVSAFLLKDDDQTRELRMLSERVKSDELYFYEKQTIEGLAAMAEKRRDWK